MSRRYVETITDLLIVAVSPALVIFMVGSLVFFATHCFYDGNFHGRLRIASGLFVIAAVLVSRISIDEGREYASMFALPLSVVTVLSMLKYTDGGLLVIALVAFIWWSTDKLTWDCTVLDDRKDASGQGLMQTVGMDSQEDSVPDQEATTDRAKAEQQSLWARWVARRRRHHTPGVWVIYFGLAAIPLFGFGQWLLPPQSLGVAFLLLCIYVASALALLLTTSFLQMRRYLIQRRLPFTDRMASVWLATGGMIIIGLMIACLVLPRPNTGYSLINSFEKMSSHERDASQRSTGREGVVDDQRDGEGESDEAAQTESRQGTQNSEQARRGNRSGDRSRKQGERDRRSESSKSDDAASRTSKDLHDDASQDETQRSPNERNQRDSRSEGRQEDREGSTENATASDRSSRRLVPPNLIPNSLPSVPRLVYLIVIAAILVVVFLRYGREIAGSIQAFFRDLADWLRRLLGGDPRGSSEERAEDRLEPDAPMRPFSSYPDPFLIGTVDRFTPTQLVNYTFEALQAWARERHCARSSEQTPLEFAMALTATNRQVAASARNLAVLYNQAAYAPGTVGKESIDHVKHVWQSLRGKAK